MKQHNIYFDREVLSSEYIESKRDFNTILQKSAVIQNKRLNSPWFYGAIGLSSIFLVSGLTVLNNDIANEELTTFNENQAVKH